MSDGTFLTLENVAVGYGRQVVLRDVNLKLGRGSFTGLLGANGSGSIRPCIGIRRFSSGSQHSDYSI